jgi:pimeloyl-ACP methyl ester carboxylesterase
VSPRPVGHRTTAQARGETDCRPFLLLSANNVKHGRNLKWSGEPKIALSDSSAHSRTLNLAQVIDVPTLVVWGDRDVALDPICLNGTERYVRDLTVKRLPGVSHWVDAPQAVNELLQEFLA